MWHFVFVPCDGNAIQALAKRKVTTPVRLEFVIFFTSLNEFEMCEHSKTYMHTGYTEAQQ